jgi:hypothetical protein
MSDKLDKHKIQELREMVKKNPTNRREGFAIFCERHGLPPAHAGTINLLVQKAI